MRRQGGGRIINVSAKRAYIGFALPTHHTAAKAGLRTLTKSLVLALAPTITVNSICPGPTATASLKASVEFVDEVREQIPLNRWRQPEDVARSVVFLASLDGDAYTGQTLDPMRDRHAVMLTCAVAVAAKPEGDGRQHGSLVPVMRPNGAPLTPLRSIRTGPMHCRRHQAENRRLRLRPQGFARIKVRCRRASGCPPFVRVQVSQGGPSETLAAPTRLRSPRFLGQLSCLSL